MKKSERVARAAKLFEDFSGHAAEYEERHEKPEFPDVAVRVGPVLGIMYETVRDGKREQYLHEFKRSARPLLIASEDGKTLYLLGGNYRFTERGIVDK